MFGLLFLLTGVATTLPDSWSAVLQYLPANAASAFTAVTQQDDALNPGPGLAAFLRYLVVLTAAWRLKRSDV
jgi:branched-subunit amino acid transport protein